MKSAIVTGASGVLGSQVVRQLLDKGVTVHAFVRSAQSISPESGLHIHEVDLASGNFVIPAGVDAIFHLAQSKQYRDFPESARAVFDVNVASTVALADAAWRAGVASFVYASSGGVYAPPEGKPLAETDPLQRPETLGFYLGGKLAAESLILSYAQVMQIAVLRYFFIYGEGQGPDMLIPRLYRRVLNGESITIDGPNGLSVNPVHSVDAAAATIAAAGRAGVFNIAGPEHISLRAMCELFAEHAGRPVDVVATGDTDTSLFADISKMRSELVAPARTLAGELDTIRRCAE